MTMGLTMRTVCPADLFGARGVSMWLHVAAPLLEPLLERHSRTVRLKKRIGRQTVTAYLVGLFGVHRAIRRQHLPTCHLDHTNNSTVLPMRTQTQKKRLEPTRIVGFHSKVGVPPTSLTTNLWKGWVWLDSTMYEADGSLPCKGDRLRSRQCYHFPSLHGSLVRSAGAGGSRDPTSAQTLPKTSTSRHLVDKPCG